MGSSLTGDADWPNLASVAHYGISLMDTALRATLEPVTVLESSDPTLVWLQAVGTVLAGLAAVISAVIAWWSHRFAQEALERQRALEHFYKTQEAASNMLTAGVDAIDKARVELDKWEKGDQWTSEDVTAAKAAVLAFEGRAQLLGAHFPDGDPLAYAVSVLARAFSDRIGKCWTTHELSQLLVRLRLDLGPFIRGPNVEELHRMYQSAVDTYKRIKEERETTGVDTAS